MWRHLSLVLVMAACGDDAVGGGGGSELTPVDGGSDLELGAEITDAGDDTDRDDAEVGPDDAVAEVADVALETDAPDTADTAGDLSEVAPEDAREDTDPDAVWRWEPGPSLPSIVQENAVLAVGDALWVLGGFQNLALVDRVRVLDPGAESWRDGPSLPRALHHMNAAVVGDEVFILGSLEGFAFAATGDSWRLDTRTASPSWVSVTAMPTARRRGSAGVAVVGGDVYVIGGFRNGAVDEADIFDTTRPDAHDAWRALPDLPGERDHAGAAAIDGKVYLVGGRDTNITSVRDDLWVFDPAAPGLGWVALPPLPTPRGGIAVAAFEGLLVVVGGEGNPAVASGVFPDVEAYDPAAEQWFTLPAMSTPRHGTGATAWAGALWVPGGADVEAFGATDVVERLVRVR